jgi:hypothetical protein
VPQLEPGRPAENLRMGRRRTPSPSYPSAGRSGKGRGEPMYDLARWIGDKLRELEIVLQDLKPPVDIPLPGRDLNTLAEGEYPESLPPGHGWGRFPDFLDPVNHPEWGDFPVGGPGIEAIRSSLGGGYDAGEPNLQGPGISEPLAPDIPLPEELNMESWGWGEFPSDIDPLHDPGWRDFPTEPRWLDDTPIDRRIALEGGYRNPQRAPGEPLIHEPFPTPDSIAPEELNFQQMLELVRQNPGYSAPGPGWMEELNQLNPMKYVMDAFESGAQPQVSPEGGALTLEALLPLFLRALVMGV